MSRHESSRPAAPPFATPECSAEPSCARDRIFEAARDLFYRHGIRGVSVDTIAAEAGTTKVTLYRVFSSKDDLVLQVLEDHNRRFWQRWDEVVARFEGEPRKQIEALFALLLEQIGAECGERGCPITNAAVEIVDHDHPARRLICEHHAEIARRFRALCREMGARRPDQLGDALTLLVEGVFAARITDGTAHIDAVEDAARALLDSPALGAPAEPTRREAPA
jgi:AcrR family transcriptional regulator